MSRWLYGQTRLITLTHSPLPITGYHGTSLSNANAILASTFRPSKNPYDWLGDGVYFFQDGLGRAWEWAYENHGEEAAVIGAEIRLEDCLDMLDTTWTRVVSDAYNRFLHLYNQLGWELPVQTSGAHRLDREVINYLVGVLAERGITIRSVRSAFEEGRPVHRDSAFYQYSHVQIAVRDVDFCITKMWLASSGQGEMR